MSTPRRARRPGDRFKRTAVLRRAPDLAQVDELLCLRKRRRVHKKWSTVEVLATRYLVDPALRGRRVDVLYDPFAPESVLIVFESVIRAATPQLGAPEWRSSSACYAKPPGWMGSDPLHAPIRPWNGVIWPLCAISTAMGLGLSISVSPFSFHAVSSGSARIRA
jgi:hypothetical protein